MARTKEQILQAIVTARDQFLASIWGRDVRRGMGDIADAVYDAVVNQLLVLDETLTQNGSGADAAAVGSALNAINATISEDEDTIADLSLKTPSNFGVLPSGSVNLTNPPYVLIGNAFFVLSSDNSYTDTPLNASFNGILLQLNYQNNSGKKIQLLATTNGKIFIRVYDTGAWGSWNGFDGDVSIDATLTVANAAADAKVTGDALATKANISSLATVATSGDYDDLSNKPVLATVATSGSYNDLSNKPNIPAVDPALTTQGAAADAKATGDALAAKANTSDLSTVAFSGSYNDLSNKPALAAVATSGSYNDLSNKPTIPTVDATLAVQGAAADAKATGDALVSVRLDISDLQADNTDVKSDISALQAGISVLQADVADGKSGISVLQAEFNALPTVAHSGLYDDLISKPDIPEVDATLTVSNAAADAARVGDLLSNKANTVDLALVATTGDYDDLNNKPIIDTTLTIQGGAADAKATGDALAAKANTSDLSTVAFSGSYNDLSNKPALAAVATSGSYNDLSNKPTIPTVDATLAVQGAAADAKATGDAISTARSEVMAAIPMIDTSLSTQGDAADAKATGDAISTARSEVMAAIPMIDTSLSTQGDAADAKATGDAISTARSEVMAAITTAMRNMGVLPNGEALGSIGSPGEPNQIYLLVSANSYTGVPTELTEPFNALLLHTSRWETVNNNETCTLARQVLFAESGEVFIRCYDANALDEHGEPVGWTQWRKSAVPVDATLTAQGAAADAKATGDLIQSVDTKATFAFNRGLTALGTLSNNSDFNNLVGKSHIYRLSQFRTYTNAPVNTAFAGWLIKTYYDDGQGTVEHGQIVFADSGEIYTRYNSGASWGSWATVANKTTIDATLSTSGAAADAAVVGTELAALKADYVVENGTSGNWTWRKWNSGILEMWGYHLSVRFDTTADGEVNWRQAGSTGFSWASGSFNFPQTFYDKTYTMNISKEYDPDAQSSNLLIYGSVHQSTSQGGVRVLIPTDQTTGLNTTRLDVHVSGRWKA